MEGRCSGLARERLTKSGGVSEIGLKVGFWMGAQEVLEEKASLRRVGQGSHRSVNAGMTGVWAPEEPGGRTPESPLWDCLEGTIIETRKKSDDSVPPATRTK